MKQLLCILTLVILTLSATPALADPVATDGTIYEFLFGAVGTFATACGGGCTATVPASIQTANSPWTFTGPAILSVLDLFLSIDRFEVFDNNVSLGLTSAPTLGGVAGNNIVQALADARYSRGIFALGDGNHSITIRVNQGGVGAAVFNVLGKSTSVPEPGTITLLGIGLGLVGIASRRKRSNA
jgi:hypothetical protein